jgi:hypothetical protein
VRDDRPLIRTRDDLLELIAHVLRLQLSYLSRDQALAVADTILRTFKAARLSIRLGRLASTPGSGNILAERGSIFDTDTRGTVLSFYDDPIAAARRSSQDKDSNDTHDDVYSETRRN